MLGYVRGRSGVSQKRRMIQILLSGPTDCPSFRCYLENYILLLSKQLICDLFQYWFLWVDSSAIFSYKSGKGSVMRQSQIPTGRQHSRCTSVLECVASVSVGFSARLRHFSPFGGAKLGASATLMEGAGRGRGASPFSHFFYARHNFRAFRKQWASWCVCDGKTYICLYHLIVPK